MGFQKGEGGRPQGVQNKLTRTVKETVLAVFQEIQSDPHVNLAAFAKKYPRDFYAIAAKLIPTEVNATVNTINLKVERKASYIDAIDITSSATDDAGSAETL